MDKCMHSWHAFLVTHDSNIPQQSLAAGYVLGLTAVLLSSADIYDLWWVSSTSLKVSVAQEQG